jgi:hypothetical protein
MTDRPILLNLAPLGFTLIVILHEYYYLNHVEMTLTSLCDKIFDLDIEVDLAYINNCLGNIFST